MAEQAIHDLQELRRQYFSLYPAIFLRLPSSSNLSSGAGQQYLIDHVLADDKLSAKGKEPERGYRKQFWKRVMRELEAGVEARVEAGEDLELDERLYEAYADLMVSSAPGGVQQGPQPSYKTFIYNDHSSGANRERMITLYEEQVTVQAGSTGLRTWTASLHLAHQILRNPALISPQGLQNACVLELGAGTGFLSIFLAQQGAQVVATDLGDDPSGEEIGGNRRTPLESLAHNISLNEVVHPPVVKPMDWFGSLESEKEQTEAFRELIRGPEDGKGVVVAADVIYDPSIVPALVATISLLLRSRSHALIAATVRNETTLALFISSCAAAGLSVDHLQLEPMPFNEPTFYDSGAMGVTEEVRILRIVRPPQA